MTARRISALIAAQEATTVPVPALTLAVDPSLAVKVYTADNCYTMAPLDAEEAVAQAAELAMAESAWTTLDLISEDAAGRTRQWIATHTAGPGHNEHTVDVREVQS